MIYIHLLGLFLLCAYMEKIIGNTESISYYLLKLSDVGWGIYLAVASTYSLPSSSKITTLMLSSDFEDRVTLVSFLSAL